MEPAALEGGGPPGPRLSPAPPGLLRNRGNATFNGTLKTIFWWMVIFVLVIVLWHAFQAGKNARHELTFSDFMQEVEAGRGRGRGARGGAAGRRGGRGGGGGGGG